MSSDQKLDLGTEKLQRSESGQNSEGKDLSAGEQPQSSQAEEKPATMTQVSEFGELFKQHSRLVEDTLKSIVDILEKRLQYDKTKEDAFDRLYQDLDHYKKNFMFDVAKPILMDLILLYDRIQSILISIDDKTSLKALQASLVTIGDEVIEILNRRDVSLIENAPSVFDSGYQRAVGKGKAETEQDNNRVEKVIRRGFRVGDRVLRPEEVIVKRFERDNNA